MQTDMKNQDQAHFRLVLDVSYQLHGENAVEMQKLLRRMVERAIGEGLLTGESDAEVDNHAVRVQMMAPVDEDTIATHLLHRIESGDLLLEDIPVRLARYGLLDPSDFVAEMRERMAMAQEDAA